MVTLFVMLLTRELPWPSFLNINIVDTQGPVEGLEEKANSSASIQHMAIKKKKKTFNQPCYLSPDYLRLGD